MTKLYRPYRQHPRRTFYVILVIMFSFPLLTTCLPSPVATVKIGLVAPFSGRYREIGYQAIRGARLAIADYYATHGNYHQHVELVAFDDAGLPNSAIEQAHKLLVDPEVVAVVGHWLDETTSATVPIYTEAGLPILATSVFPVQPEYGGTLFFRLHPNKTSITAQMQSTANQYDALSTCLCGVITGAKHVSDVLSDNPNATIVGGPLWSLQEFMHIAGPHADLTYSITSAPHPLIEGNAASFVERYQTTYPGDQPGWVSVHAYEAIRVVLLAITASPVANGDNVASNLSQTNYSTGLLGPISFNDNGEWKKPSYHVYAWRNSHLIHP